MTVLSAHSQPQTLEFDKQIVRSDFFSDEYPDYPVCKIEKLSMIGDVADNITPGQCVKKSSDNLMFVGGTCGEGSSSGGGSSGGGSGSGAGGGSSGAFIELVSTPTDLSSYANGQILRVKTPEPGEWLVVEGADSGEQHLFKMTGVTDPQNSNNWGFSLVGDTYGEVRTWDGGKELTASNSPVLRMELQDDSTDDLILLVAKSAVTYANAPATLYIRFYQGEIGSLNYVLENGIELERQSDNTNFNYTSYAVASGDIGDVTRLLGDRQYIVGWGLFTSPLPAQTDQTTNAFNLHSAKTTTEIDPQPAVWARAGKPVPSGTFALSADNADLSKSLEMVAIEITPPVSGINSSDITFIVYDSDFYNSIAASGFTLRGSRTVANNNLLELFMDTGVSFTNRLRATFLYSFIIPKSPITITVNGNDYGLGYSGNHTSGGDRVIRFLTSTLPSEDRISASDLTKTINVEFVENTTYTFSRVPSSNQSIILTGDPNITVSYRPFNRCWDFTYIGTKTPRYFMINGQKINLSTRRQDCNSNARANTYSPFDDRDVHFRPIASSLTFGINIQFTDDTYWNNTRTHLFQTESGATPEVRAQKILTRPQVNDWLSTKQLVSTPPANPQTGQLIEMLADATFRGGTVLKARTKTGVGAGTFTGFARAALLSDQSVNLGNINPDNANIGIIASYIGTHTTPAFRNKVVFTRALDTYSPAKIVFNGTEYTLTADATLSDYFIASTLTGSSIENGKEYYINFEDSTGNKLFPDITLKQGSTYRWTGTYWFEEKEGLDESQVDARIQSWARNPKPTGDQYIPADQICQELTSAQFTALSSKVSNRMYCVEVTGQ